MDDRKRYYWIKLKTDFFDIPTIDWLMEQEDGCAYVVLYIKLCLLTANQGGALVRQIGEMIIPYEPKKIAEVTRFSINTVTVALELYKRLGLIYVTEDGIMMLAGVDTMVGSEAANSNAQRQRRFRERRRQEESLPAPIDEEPENSADVAPEPLQNVTETAENDVTEPVTESVTKRNVEIRDQSLEIRGQSKSKEKRKKKEKATGTPVEPPTPDFTGTNFSDEMRSKIEEWIQYKAERAAIERKKVVYTPIGLRNLISEIQNNVNRYGERAVIDLIRYCMGQNYQGIIFARLAEQAPMYRRAEADSQGETYNPFARLVRRGGEDQ